MEGKHNGASWITYVFFIGMWRHTENIFYQQHVRILWRPPSFGGKWERLQGQQINAASIMNAHIFSCQSSNWFFQRATIGAPLTSAVLIKQRGWMNGMKKTSHCRVISCSSSSCTISDTFLINLQADCVWMSAAARCRATGDCSSNIPGNSSSK